MDSSQRNGRRRSIRLQEYDYSQAGAYFVTACMQHKACLLGQIVDGGMHLNAAGKMIEAAWNQLTVRFPGIELDEFVVMPNHIHGILTLPCRGEPCVRPPMEPTTTEGEHKVRPYGTVDGSLGRIVQAFKSITTNGYIKGVKEKGWEPFPGRLWQRNYWDHVIRSEYQLSLIREYIQNNPAKWELDKLYVATEPTL